MCHADVVGAAPKVWIGRKRTRLRAQPFQIESTVALTFWWSMIFSENRFPLFLIML